MSEVQQYHEGGLFYPSPLVGGDAASSRAVILYAAYLEIHETGFQAASLSKILKNTGLTKGALYHHFPSKLDLGYAVLDEMVKPQLQEHWCEPLRQHENPIGTLIAILTESQALITHRDIELGCPLNNLAQEMSSVDEGFRIRIDAIFVMWREAIASALEKGKINQTVQEDVDTEALAIMLVATLEGCIGAAKSAQSKDVLSKCGTSLVMILNNLRSCPQSHG